MHVKLNLANMKRNINNYIEGPINGIFSRDVYNRGL